MDFAVVAAQPRYLDRDLVSVADRGGVRMIALTESEADRRYAASLGLFETAEAASSWPQIEAALLDVGTVEPAAMEGEESVPERRGQVIAVWGPAGSPGRTSLAIALAAELADVGKSVLLADVDTHNGSVAPSLGMLDESPGFAAACRLASTDSLTRLELDRIADHYTSNHGGFRVLTGLGRPSRWPELSAERVSTTLGVCRQWVDYTVIDAGASLENDEEISSDLVAPRRNAATITALRDADLIVAVGSADPVGLSRFLRSYAEVLETIQTDRVVVVMNRLRSSAIGVNASVQVRQALERFAGIRSPVLVPYDRAAFDAAVLSGQTLRDAAPRSPARLAVAGLVAEHLHRPAAPKRRPLSRYFSFSMRASRAIRE